MGLLSNRVDRESLKLGDHIYSWRAAYIYAHHGIYIGDEKVIHFTRHGPKVGTSSVLDVLMVSSVPTPSLTSCPNCTHTENNNEVITSCLDCFLAGGVLYRFEYSANPAVFFVKARRGTCTFAASDPPGAVLHRANYLLDKGFGCYNIFKNNCEDFAIYCKTGLLVSGKKSMGQSGQVASLIDGPLVGFLSVVVKLVKTNVYVKTASVASSVATYCVTRYATDIGIRSDVVKVRVEDLPIKHHNIAT
ncbi:unnamed protein product [Lactuca virosa]|uniref:LRAT domain-containing protein n=1 Tax=Lactuca virosa TaxID=75947 RepID=A0AAU9LZ04_9ASTR|nr:unnamed protein product [Lactuca virosa]